jgi:hypothetical protein
MQPADFFLSLVLLTGENISFKFLKLKYRSEKSARKNKVKMSEKRRPHYQD